MAIGMEMKKKLNWENKIVEKTWIPASAGMTTQLKWLKIAIFRYIY
jgi:hypothetical protein